MLQSRNAALTSLQPGERVTTTTTTVTKTAVERRAIATARASFETGAAAPPRIRDLRLSFSGLLQDGCAVGAREPRLLQLLDRAVQPQTIERPVDAGRQLAALREDGAEALRCADGLQPPDDLGCRNLHARDVERGRQVDDDAVDETALERLNRLVVRVVGPARRGLDHVADVRRARRADLGSEPVVLERSDRLRTRDWLALQRDERLVHEVVALREIDRLCPLRAVGHLRQVEVERLLPGPVRVVEGDDGPLDLSRGEAELLRDCVGDGGLVALA